MEQTVLDFLKDEDKQNVRFFVAGNERFVLVNKPSFVEKEKNYDVIKLYKVDTLEEVGEVQYKFTLEYANKVAFLYNIRVNSGSELGKGLGTYTIKFFEEVVHNTYIRTIEGKFYPKAPATGEQVRKFYERNGYSIEKDGYETMIYKYLLTEDILTIRHNTKMDKNGYKWYGKLEYMPSKKIEELQR